MGLRIGAVIALVSALWLGSLAAAPSVHADGAAAVLYGRVLPDGDGQLPVRVRAVSDTGVVCGTATVQPETETVGVYAMRVIGADVKAGCPADGEFFSVMLLYGLIDGDGPAASRVLMRTGVAMPVDLARASAQPGS